MDKRYAHVYVVDDDRENRTQRGTSPYERQRAPSRTEPSAPPEKDGSKGLDDGERPRRKRNLRYLLGQKLAAPRATRAARMLDTGDRHAQTPTAAAASEPNLKSAPACVVGQPPDRVALVRTAAGEQLIETGRGEGPTE